MYLAIDTFSDVAGLSIFNQNQILTTQMFYKKRQFSDFFPYKLETIKKELDFNFKTLKGVIVNKGPGSYTGIRVGITIAKTIAYSLNIPIYAFISLDAIAYKFRTFNGKIHVVINAGKGEAYIRSYTVKNFEIFPETNLHLVKQSEIYLDENEKSLIVYKNINRFKDYKNSIELKESVAYEGGMYAIENNLKEDTYKLEPVYLREL